MSSEVNFQEILQKIALLANSPIALELFFQKYLESISAVPGFAGCAIWIQHGGEFALFGGSDSSSVKYESSPTQKKFIQKIVAQCGTSQQVQVVGPKGSPGAHENEADYVLIFTPLVSGTPGNSDALQGVQMIWLSPSFPCAIFDQIQNFLYLAGLQCAVVMRNNRLSRAAESLEQVQRMVKLLSNISGITDLRDLGIKLVNLCHEIIGCERCAVFLPPRKGKEPRLLAVSHMSTPEPKSALLRSMAMAAKEVLNSGQPTVYKRKEKKDEQVGNIGDFFFYTDSEALGCFPMTVEKKVVGVLLAEFKTFADNENARLNSGLSVAHHCAQAIQSADFLDALPFRKQFFNLNRFLLEHPNLRNRILAKRVLVPAASFLFLALCPWSLDIAGDCTIVPTNRIQVVSEIPGKIINIFVENGQPMAPSQPIVQVEDLEIRRQLEILRQEENRFRIEADFYRKSDERALARLADLQLERVRKQIEYWQNELQKTTLRSPIAGTLYAPRIRELLGSLVQPGTTIAIVGDPSAWQLQIFVPENDIALIAKKLAEKNSLSVRFLLNSLPHQKFTAQLTSLDQISPYAEVIKNRNTFEITIPLPASAEQTSFRYGFEGRAKIHIGIQPAGVLLLRSFLNWLRIHVLL